MPSVIDNTINRDIPTFEVLLHLLNATSKFQFIFILLVMPLLPFLQRLCTAAISCLSNASLVRQSTSFLFAVICVQCGKNRLHFYRYIFIELETQ